MTALSVRARGSSTALLTGTAGLTVMVLSMQQTLVLPILHTMADQLHSDLTDVEWVLTANLLAASIVTPVLGRLGDIYGKRKLILAVLVVAAGGSLLAALTASLPLLIAARVLQAASFGLLPLSIGVLRDELPADRLMPALATTSALIGIGGGGGWVLSGLLTQHGGSYRNVFWLSLGVSVLAFVAAAAVLPPPRTITRRSRVDYLGAATLGLGLALLLLPLSEAGSWGWASFPTIGCFVGSAAVLAAFWQIETGRREPLIAPRLLVHRPIWVTNVVAILLGFAAYNSFLGTSEFAQSPTSTGYGLGASVLRTTVEFLLPGSIAGLLIAPFTGRIIKRHGGRPTLMVGGGLGALSFLLMVPFHSESALLVFYSLGAVGNIVGYSSVPAMVVANVAPDETGVAAGFASIARNIGGSLASASSATLVTGVLTAAGIASVVAYQVIFGLAAAAMLAAAALCWFALDPDRPYDADREQEVYEAAAIVADPGTATP
jgi:MFS family permease